MSRALRVLYVVTAYPRHAEDVITPWLVETVHRLRDAGVEIEVLAPSYRGLASGIRDGVPVHRFRYAPRRWEDLTHDETVPDRLRRRRGSVFWVAPYVMGGMKAAWRLARTGRFHVVHVHWPLPHALFGLAARSAAGLPFVCSFHGVELTWTRRQWPVFLPILRYIIRTADAVTANSSYTAEMIRTLYERPIERIPFGAAVAPEPVPGMTPARAEIQAPHEPVRGRRSPFHLLFVGRLVERKGVHVLLEAAARVRAQHELQLHIVGDGPMRGTLEARARALGLDAAVAFHGIVPQAELAHRFAECDAFVLPAVVDRKGDTEGLGVVLVEALSHGKPVIATAAGGIVDIVRHGETGILVAPGDVEALARAILRTIEDPEEARALAAAGRAHVASQFSWSSIVGDLTSLYERLAGIPQTTVPA